MSGLLIHDTPELAAQRADMQARFDAAQDLVRTTGKTAMQRAMDAIDARAKRARSMLIKNAARRYLARPQFLDAIRLGLSNAHPAFILVAVEQEARIPWGRVDMLGVIPVNLAGAALYARWLRREMRRERKVAQVKELAHAP